MAEEEQMDGPAGPPTREEIGTLLRSIEVPKHCCGFNTVLFFRLALQSGKRRFADKILKTNGGCGMQGNFETNILNPVRRSNL